MTALLLNSASSTLTCCFFNRATSVHAKTSNWCPCFCQAKVVNHAEQLYWGASGEVKHNVHSTVQCQYISYTTPIKAFSEGHTTLQKDYNWGFLLILHVSTIVNIKKKKKVLWERSSFCKGSWARFLIDHMQTDCKQGYRVLQICTDHD